MYETFIDTYTFSTTHTEKHFLYIMHDRVIVLLYSALMHCFFDNFYNNCIEK